MKDVKNLLNIAKKTARKAGDLLIVSVKEGRRIDKQHQHDIKLKADKMSEALIINELKATGDIAIISEEAGHIRGDIKGLCWIVDPLDGTINYSRSVPLFCVSIGLWDGNVPVCGVVYDPCRQEMFSGIVGQGAWLNGGKIKVSGVRKKQDAILATGFPAKADLSNKSIENFARNVRAYKKLRFIGSAALSLAYVAAGRFDAYTEREIMFWDVAGGIALVEAAGGKAIMKKTMNINSYHVSGWNGNFSML